MPLYEYICGKCGAEFEKLARSADERVECPCGSNDVVRKVSTFGASGNSAECFSGG